jgi:hypothetical protein
MNISTPNLILRITFNPPKKIPGGQNQSTSTPIEIDAELSIDFQDRSNRRIRGEQATILEAKIRELLG